MKFRKERNNARKVITDAKEHSWQNFVEGVSVHSSSSELWRRVNVLQGRPQRSKPSIKIDGSFSDDPVQVSESFADYYEKISIRDTIAVSERNSDDLLQSNVDTTASYNQDISLSELDWALSKCTSKSTGSDNIGYPLLKHLPITGKSAILNCYNHVWRTGKIPDIWKESIIVPIPKKIRKHGSPDEYRPISLINCMAKVLERVINRRLITFIEEENLLDPRQYAFRAGLGTDVYFSELEDFLDNPIKQNQHCELLSIDISKASFRYSRQRCCVGFPLENEYQRQNV